MMNKFINDPDNLTAELLEGYVLAYPDQVKLPLAEKILLCVHMRKLKIK